jgi:beta-glucosidase
MVLLLGGYLQGGIPPGLNNSEKALEAICNISSAHVAAREEILALCGPRPIGIAQNLMAFAPDRRWHPLDLTLCRVAAYNYNHSLLEALTSGRLQVFMPGLLSVDRRIDGGRNSLDFIGVNYYTRAHLRFIWKRPFVDFAYRDKLSRGLTHIGWEDYPEGFGQVLREVKRYGRPVWITENGIDDRVGNRRPQFLYSHWKQVIAAIESGVDVRGYLYWSLLDNFEWLEAWGPRFGLYRVDFASLERTPTPACDYFRETASSRVLNPPPSAERESAAVAA